MPDTISKMGATCAIKRHHGWGEGAALCQLPYRIWVWRVEASELRAKALRRHELTSMLAPRAHEPQLAGAGCAAGRVAVLCGALR